MRFHVGLLIVLSVATGFSGVLITYFPVIAVGVAIVGGLIALTTESGPDGPWPLDDIRSESTAEDWIPPGDY